jgi:predicted transcriptional regulator
MVDLGGLRRMVGVTQVELAEALKTSQGQISRLEKQRDMLLSTLGAYLTALRVDAKVVIEVDGQTLTYDLTAKGGNR